MTTGQSNDTVETFDVGGAIDNSTLTINVPDYDLSTLSTTLSGLTSNAWNTGNITISTAGNSGLNSNYAFNAPAYTVGPYSTGSNSLDVKGDANFEGDLKWQGRSLGDILNKIERRLAILTPDSKKLEHFAALQKAYDNYKTLEALCELPEEEDDHKQP